MFDKSAGKLELVYQWKRLCNQVVDLIEFEEFLGRVGQLAKNQWRIQIDLFAQRADDFFAIVAVGEDARSRDQSVNCVADGPYQDPIRRQSSN